MRENTAEAVAAIRATVDGDAGLAQWLDAILASDEVVMRPSTKVRAEQLGFDGESLHLDTAPFRIANIREAVGLAERIVQFRHCVVDYIEGDTGL